MFGGGPQAQPRTMASVGAVGLGPGAGPDPAWDRAQGSPTEAMGLGQAWGPPPNR